MGWKIGMMQPLLLPLVVSAAPVGLQVSFLQVTFCLGFGCTTAQADTSVQHQALQELGTGPNLPWDCQSLGKLMNIH